MVSYGGGEEGFGLAVLETILFMLSVLGLAPAAPNPECGRFRVCQSIWAYTLQQCVCVLPRILAEWGVVVGSSWPAAGRHVAGTAER